MIKISVIMPVYNLSLYLSESIESILSQSFKDFELILINDGSTDSSGIICDKYKEKDSRVKVIHKENEGSGIARNIGINCAKGQFLMFLDGDDKIESNLLEKLYLEIISSNTDLVICNYSEFTDENIFNIKKQIKEEVIINGKLECRKTYIDLLKKEVIQSPWNKIYKASIINENNIRFPNLRRCQDAVFNCEYFNYIESYKLIPDTLYHYRINNNNTCWEKFPKDFFDIALKLNSKYITALENWNILNKDDFSYLCSYFINDVVGCMIYSFSPKWNFNKQERKQYIASIIKHEKTQQAIKNCNTNTIFMKIIKVLIEFKSVSTLMLLMKIRILLQK